MLNFESKFYLFFSITEEDNEIQLIASMNVMKIMFFDRFF